jgi:hypothetical protein
MRWLLDHAAAGAALTATGNLARPLVAEGCRRFGWLTLTGNPRSESAIVELWTLRDWANQMGVLRRSGRRLLLSSTGKAVHTGGTAALWQATTEALLGPGEAEAAAAETALMHLFIRGPTDYRDLNSAVADVLAGEGWHGQRDGIPVTAEQAAGLLGHLRRRLRLLGLTTQERLGEPTRLTPTGHAAVHTALRAAPCAHANTPSADADPARHRPDQPSSARSPVWTADGLTTVVDAVVVYAPFGTESTVSARRLRR